MSVGEDAVRALKEAAERQRIARDATQKLAAEIAADREKNQQQNQPEEGTQ